MKAFAFALLLVVTVAHAGDVPEPPTKITVPASSIQSVAPGVGVIQFPPRPNAAARYWICPKDETMLRVPHSNHSGEFKCPVDGTPMKPGLGRTSAYFLLQEPEK